MLNIRVRSWPSRLTRRARACVVQGDRSSSPDYPLILSALFTSYLVILFSYYKTFANPTKNEPDTNGEGFLQNLTNSSLFCSSNYTDTKLTLVLDSSKVIDW